MKQTPRLVRKLATLAEMCHGVLSVHDLEIFFDENRPTPLARCIAPYLEDGSLERYAKGWYLWEKARPDVLASKMSPGCVLSFGTALAYHLLVGTAPRSRIDVIHTKREKNTEGRFYLNFHHLDLKFMEPFTIESRGIRMATPEKAVLDTLYFSLHGKRYPFDLWSDIDRSVLNRQSYLAQLSRYQNSRFRVFAKRWLENEV